MKKILSLIAFVVIASSTSAFAQDFGSGGFMGGGFPDFPSGMSAMESEVEIDELDSVTSAKDYAAEHTDRLASSVTLSDEQYKQVFKIYKTEAQTYLNSKAMSAGSFDMMRGMGKSSSSSEREKRIEKRNKKMADILSSEQFNIYLRLES